ncbi:MAG: transketolase [Nanoarchaeota archaeon]|nr:transketolase [Nanoarchaeota archaeon]
MILTLHKIYKPSLNLSSWVRILLKKITDIKELKLMANTIRQDIIKMLAEAKSGHTAGALGMADMFTGLFFNAMDLDPKNVDWEGRDYFVLSNGHICAVLYAAMANAGYFPREELMTFRKLGSRLQGHPHRKMLPGLETTSGPLGCGLSQAAGMAYAFKHDKKPNKVFCFLGDGELQEGNIWEGMMFAAKHKLDNLICAVDRNYIQIDGNTEDVMPLDPYDKKCQAFNWNTITIDGNDMKEIVETFKKAKENKGKPLMIIARTVACKGICDIEGDCGWHGKPPTPEEAVDMLKELQQTRKTLEAKK